MTALNLIKLTQPSYLYVCCQVGVGEALISRGPRSRLSVHCRQLLLPTGGQSVSHVTATRNELDNPPPCPILSDKYRLNLPLSLPSGSDLTCHSRFLLAPISLVP